MSELKKFLINIDGSLDQFLYFFYFSHLIHKNFDEVHIDLLIPELGPEQNELFDYSVLSPFEIHTHRVPKKVMSSVTEAHKYAVNLNDIFNIDYYVDFMQTNVSAFLGTAFKAPRRFGKAGIARSLLLTDSFKVESTQDLFGSVIAKLGWNFDFESLQREQSPSSQKALLLMTEIQEEDRNLIQEHLGLDEATNFDEIQKVAAVFDSYEYVITSNPDMIAMFKYFNKTIVLAPSEHLEGVLLSFENDPHVEYFDDFMKQFQIEVKSKNG